MYTIEVTSHYGWMSNLAKCKNDAAGAFKKKSLKPNVCLTSEEKKGFEKIKFQSFYLRVHMKNICDLPLFIGFLKFSYSALFKQRQAFMEIIKKKDLGKIEEETTRI